LRRIDYNRIQGGAILPMRTMGTHADIIEGVSEETSNAEIEINRLYTIF
jgi:hypothetical protein